MERFPIFVKPYIAVCVVLIFLGVHSRSLFIFPLFFPFSFRLQHKKIPLHVHVCCGSQKVTSARVLAKRVGRFCVEAIANILQSGLVTCYTNSFMLVQAIFARVQRARAPFERQIFGLSEFLDWCRDSFQGSSQNPKSPFDRQSCDISAFVPTILVGLLGEVSPIFFVDLHLFAICLLTN